MATRYQDWLWQAKRDVEHARASLEGGFYEWACFAAQQGAEKALKAVFQRYSADAWGHLLADLMEALPAEVTAPPGLMQRAKELGKHMTRRFAAMQKKSKLIADVRGLGAMVAVELVTDHQQKTPASEQTAFIIKYALEHGVITAKAGLYGNVLRMLLPLNIPQDLLDQGFDVLEEAIVKVS